MRQTEEILRDYREVHEQLRRTLAQIAELAAEPDESGEVSP